MDTEVGALGRQGEGVMCKLKHLLLLWHIWWTKAAFRRLENDRGHVWEHYGAAPDGFAYVVRTDRWAGDSQYMYGPYAYAWQAIRLASWHVFLYPRGRAQLGLRDRSTGTDRPCSDQDNPRRRA